MTDLQQAIKALEFYARREHWMRLTEDSEHSQLLVAIGKENEPDGYSVADRALKSIARFQRDFVK